MCVQSAGEGGCLAGVALWFDARIRAGGETCAAYPSLSSSHVHAGMPFKPFKSQKVIASVHLQTPSYLQRFAVQCTHDRCFFFLIFLNEFSKVSLPHSEMTAMGLEHRSPSLRPKVNWVWSPFSVYHAL